MTTTVPLIPAIHHVTITSAATEYRQALSGRTRSISIQNQGSIDLQLAFEGGKVATPTAPYVTIKAGSAYNDTFDRPVSGIVVFLASRSASQTAEIIEWSEPE